MTQEYKTIEEMSSFLKEVKTLAAIARRADVQMRELYAENTDRWPEVLHVTESPTEAEIIKMYNKILQAGNLK